jgi:hypothetical protein
MSTPRSAFSPSRLAVASILAVWMCSPFLAAQASEASSDLDRFMARVLARRDENWKKLQQYVLDERESIEVLAPGRVRLFGLHREYTWFIRDGFFVRSPVRFDGVELGDAERREYERGWIERQRQREAKAAGGDAPPATASQEVGDVLRQTVEPAFVSAAYFLKFKFEPNRYAFVGRETLDGRDVLRIEYYPTRLFQDEPRDDERKERKKPEKPRSEQEREQEDRLARQMNKVALVTLWVEPSAHQIIQYTFENVGFDFLPGRSLVRVDDVRASMRMGEAFPAVWLPRDIDGRFAVTLAKGTYEARFDVDYVDYRQADVKVQVR